MDISSSKKFKYPQCSCITLVPAHSPRHVSCSKEGNRVTAFGGLLQHRHHGQEKSSTVRWHLRTAVWMAGLLQSWSEIVHGKPLPSRMYQWKFIIFCIVNIICCHYMSGTGGHFVHIHYLSNSADLGPGLTGSRADPRSFERCHRL